jgi:hypothetical protein
MGGEGGAPWGVRAVSGTRSTLTVCVSGAGGDGKGGRGGYGATGGEGKGESGGEGGGGEGIGGEGGGGEGGGEGGGGEGCGGEGGGGVGGGVGGGGEGGTDGGIEGGGGGAAGGGRGGPTMVVVVVSAEAFSPREEARDAGARAVVWFASDCDAAAPLAEPSFTTVTCRAHGAMGIVSMDAPQDGMGGVAQCGRRGARLGAV